MKAGITKYIELELAPLTREERRNCVENQIIEIENENWSFEDVSQLIEEVEKKSVYVRQPLFEKIIYPILKSEIAIKNAEAVKCLIKLEPNLFAYQRKHQIDEYTTWSLVETGLAFDENDKELLKRYAHLLHHWLDYTIHELPDFLIYNDFEETTPERCDELIELSEKYKDVCRKLGVEEEEHRKDLIEECEFHYPNYKTYLDNLDKYKNYEAYLKINKLSWFK
jgi:hypothetical protein